MADEGLGPGFLYDIHSTTGPLLDALFLAPVIAGYSMTGAQHEWGEAFSGPWRYSDNEIAATWTCDVFSQSLLPFKITHFKEQCIRRSHS